MAANGRRAASTASSFSVPGMSRADSSAAAALLQQRLESLIDLALTLKHIHWNVVGPHFIAVHEMLDPQVDSVLAMVDETAERIATLGVGPNGLAGNLVRSRTWDDYDLGRATTTEHLGALDLVYSGVIEDHRAAMQALGDLDMVSQDLIVGQLAKLEQNHWFVRAHLESNTGELSTRNTATERAAASAARKKSARA